MLDPPSKPRWLPMGVACAKFAAAAFTGSSSMFSESVHSVVRLRERSCSCSATVPPTANQKATIRSACIVRNILPASSSPRCCSSSGGVFAVSQGDEEAHRTARRFRVTARSTRLN